MKHLKHFKKDPFFFIHVITIFLCFGSIILTIGYSTALSIKKLSLPTNTSIISPENNTNSKVTTLIDEVNTEISKTINDTIITKNNIQTNNIIGTTQVAPIIKTTQQTTSSVNEGRSKTSSITSTSNTVTPLIQGRGTPTNTSTNTGSSAYLILINGRGDSTGGNSTGGDTTVISGRDIFTGTVVNPPIPVSDIQQNINKYRNYRTRLKNNFIWITSANVPGSNIVANKRHAYAGPNEGYVDISDTVAQHGFYLGVLATEYKLLKNANKSTTQTLKELMYALQVIERLDLNAESYFGGTNSLNGFFIRDDVPSYWYPTCNPTIGNIPNPFASRFGTGMTHIGYNYGSCNLRGNEMSQDQVWGLLPGLALVKKLVDATTVDGIYFNFQEKAKNITERIIKYMHSQITITKKVLGKPITIKINKWRIKNPVSGQLVMRGSMGGSDLVAGACYGFAKAGGQIAGKNLDYATSDPERGISQFIFNQIGNGNLTRLQTLLKSAGMPQINDFSIFGMMSLGTIGNLRGSTTPTVVQQGNFDWMGLLHYVLYENNSSKILLDNKINFFKNLLNTAPAGGPYNYGGSNATTYDWSSENLLRVPDHRGIINTGDPNAMRSKVGQFNGLDYMLLHNLFLLTYENSLGTFNY